jgi:hypothetical protein
MELTMGYLGGRAERFLPDRRPWQPLTVLFDAIVVRQVFVGPGSGRRFLYSPETDAHYLKSLFAPKRMT